MVIDTLQNAALYENLGKHFSKAFNYLKTTDFMKMDAGRYVVDGDQIFAMVSEYETRDASQEKQEAHRQYIDIQYMVSGTELMGVTPLTNQQPSKEYSDEQDYLLFDESPSFFAKVEAGMFIIFFPSDLHMPCISAEPPTRVKKVVMKVHV